MLQYNRIGITIKSGLDQKNDTVQRIVTILQDAGAEVLFDPKRCDMPVSYTHLTLPTIGYV